MAKKRKLLGGTLAKHYATAYPLLVAALRESKMRLDVYRHRETYDAANALLVKLGEQAEEE